MAMELPFIFVGAVVVGGGFGWLLDHWLGTKPYLMIVFGVLGFFAGIRDILRRVPAREDDEQPGSSKH